jgi:ABC-2 type transport system permease protein
MDRILIDLKFTLLRNSSKGLRLVGWVVGALLVLGTWAAAMLASSNDVRSSVLTLTYAGWTVGAMLGPVLMSGNGVLRPDFFALLPIERRALSRGLLVTVFIGIASAYVFVAFLAAAVHAISLDPVTLIVVLVGTPLTWVFAIALSRLVYGLLGAAMRSKIGVEIAGIQFGLMFAAMFTGWMVVQAAVESVPALIINGLPDGPIRTVLNAFPSSWQVLAVEQAASGDWAGAGMLLLALAGLDVVLLLAAVAILMPRVDVPKRQRRARPLSPGLVSGGGLPPKNQLGAVIGKEYRQWTRDPWRALELRTAVWTGIAIGFFAAISGNYTEFAAFAGLIVVFMMAIAGLNLFGQDGSAVWQTIVGQDATSTRSDVRGRQWAMVLVFVPHALLVSVIFLLVTQHFWVAPILLAAMPAFFGSGSGAALITSAVGVSPGVDPRRRTGPNDANGNVSVHVWIVMLLTVIGVVPTVAAVLASLFFPSPWLTVASAVVGVLNGWLAAWLFGNFAIRYLTTRMPDVFSRIRYGQVFRDTEDSVLGWIESTTLQGEQKLVAQRKKERQDRIDARARV